MGIVAYGKSEQGTSHVDKGVECQDSCGLRKITSKDKETFVVAAIADGVGSCNRSAEGSSEAVTSAIDYIENEIFNIKIREIKIKKAEYFNYFKTLINKAFEHARNRVEELADRSSASVLSFSSTLAVAIYDGCDVFFGNAGDSGIVTLNTDGKYEMISTRQKGEEANSVIPLQSGKWEIGVAEKIVMCCMLTDGVLDVVAPEIKTKELIYWPFFESFLISKSVDADRKMKNIIEGLVNGNEVKSKVSDDITILAICNVGTEYSKPDFDLNQYLKKCDEIREEQEKALYSNNQSTGNISWRGTVQGESAEQNQKNKPTNIWQKDTHQKKTATKKYTQTTDSNDTGQQQGRGQNPQNRTGQQQGYGQKDCSYTKSFYPVYKNKPKKSPAIRAYRRVMVVSGVLFALLLRPWLQELFLGGSGPAEPEGGCLCMTVITNCITSLADFFASALYVLYMLIIGVGIGFLMSWALSSLFGEEIFMDKTKVWACYVFGLLSVLLLVLAFGLIMGMLIQTIAFPFLVAGVFVSAILLVVLIGLLL